MAFTLEQLKTVRRLSDEVDQLAADVMIEMVEYGRSLHAQHPETFPDKFIPHTAPGSPKTGELRRRSMDLTRALAELRR
jgi:hypothetical protein